MRIGKYGIALFLVSLIALVAPVQAEETDMTSRIQIAQGNNCKAQCQQKQNECKAAAQGFINQGKGGTTQWPCHDDCSYAISSFCPSEYNDCVKAC